MSQTSVTPPPAVSPQRRAVRLALALTVLGVVLLVYGAWRAYPPAGFIVAGMVFLTFGVGALRG